MRIKLDDLKLLKGIKLSKKNFPWTVYGTFWANIALINAYIFVGLIKYDKDLITVIGQLPIGFAIITFASLVVFPAVDVYENLIDRIMCRELQWDYATDFLNKLSLKQQEQCRTKYKAFKADGTNKDELRELMNKYLLET